MPAPVHDQNRIIIRLLGLPAGTIHPTARQLLGLHSPAPNREEIDRALGVRLRHLRASIPPQFKPILLYLERRLQDAATELKTLNSPAIFRPDQVPAHTHPARSPGASPVPPTRPVLKPKSLPAPPTKVATARVTRHVQLKSLPGSDPKPSRPPAPPKLQGPQAFGLQIDPDAMQYRRECAQDEPVAELKYELWDQLDRWLKHQRTK